MADCSGKFERRAITVTFDAFPALGSEVTNTIEIRSQTESDDSIVRNKKKQNQRAAGTAAADAAGGAIQKEEDYKLLTAIEFFDDRNSVCGCRSSCIVQQYNLLLRRVVAARPKNIACRARSPFQSSY